MQTQTPQSSKKNKVTVPFYSPPSRLYGQTPAEIIKEARAAVLNTSPTGIKPVFTSRPFTPKENERTLFGNVKKRSGRPPSSFSLKNQQSQESGLGVKLPSIEVVSRKKLISTFHYSNNLSLDNLTEDYDAEVLEEIGEIESTNLPKWKKSHSCPKEGRMVKAASYNELSYRTLSQSTNKWRESNSTQENEFKKLNSPDVADPGSNAPCGKSNKVEEPELQSPNSYRYLNMTRGGGDYELVKKPNNFSQVESSNKENEKVAHLKDNEKGEDEVQASDKLEVESQQKQQEISKSQPKNIDNSKTNVSLTLDVDKEKSTKEENLKTDEKKILQSKEKVSEKSTVTDPKSDYLASLTKENLSSSKEPYQAVPTEILQLYETARYYGVDVTETGHAKGSTSDRSTSLKNVDDYFGEKQNDYLSQLKENFSRVDEKMKYLNETLDKSQKNSSKSDTIITEKGSDKIQFVMNNKKRYHIVSEKSDVKEKAYKKWNSKQQEHNSSPNEPASNRGWDLFWKNSYFRSKDEDESTSQNGAESKDAAGEEYIQLLVNKLTKLAKKGEEKENVHETVSGLYNFLKQTKTVLDGKLKPVLLKALYLYVDDESPKILLSLAKVLLFLKIESVLPVAFKMIFKVARSDDNDGLFLNEEDVLELFLEGIGRASPLDNAESCIYGYGALKFLTMNYNILSRILNMGALDLMALHLKLINSAHTDKGNVGEQTQHALFQLTGALRHVAAGEGALPLFLTTNCITIMCRTLQLFQKDDDVVTNISRTLSLLSTDESVIQTLMSVENILITIIELIERYKENDKILIRLSYCLGNIVEHSDLARVQISRNEASLSIILNTLKLYINKDLEISMRDNNKSNSEELSSDIIDDVIVKIIRILANMSMNPIVGSNLSPTTNEKNSLQLSKLLSVLLMRKDPGMTLLATLGCLNNISYYCNTHSVLIDITQGIERVLGLPSEDCQAEAARVLGNLTRHKEIRNLIYNTGGVSNLLKLLTSQNQEVVRCACGALVNMMLDPETRKQFVEAQGIDKLVKALELFFGDWPLASLATRAIWNSCADDLSSAMMHNNTEHLSNILANSLEEENWNDGDPAWEEFASIATDLLERINTHLEST